MYENVVDTPFERRFLRALDGLERQAIKRRRNRTIALGHDPYTPTVFDPVIETIGGDAVRQNCGRTGIGVYFVHAADRIKIGQSCRLAKRLAELKTGSPFRLIVLGVIYTQDRETSIALERELHLAFHPIRACGEWFLDQSPLRLFIQLRSSPWSWII
jgi:hypothetical protein